jgi:uncharacterized protein (TIGR00299 family) protein
MKTLHFDCFAGISGDMTLGALVDLEVNPERLRGELEKLGLPGWTLRFVRDERGGITGTHALVDLEDGTDHIAHDEDHPDHDHPGSAEAGHSHPASAERSWKDIRAIIEGAPLSAGAKGRALAIFTLIAQAEAEVHGVKVEEVRFHEVGALDSIIDIVGAAICLDLLKPDRITCGEIELGGGTVKAAHGVLPVPAPATLKLLRGLRVRTGGFNKEMTTPTGAAILAASVDDFVAGSRCTELKTGDGIGTRRMDKPNVLRVSWREEEAPLPGILGAPMEPPRGAPSPQLPSTPVPMKPTGGPPMGAPSPQLLSTLDPMKPTGGPTGGYLIQERTLLEANIDDMSGEALGFLMERLFEGGALDVTFTPCMMKKSRPGTTVSVLAAEESLHALRETLFRHSTTIGFREIPVRRLALRRESETLRGDFGQADRKTVYLGAEPLRSKLEFEDRARIARERGVSLDEAEQLITGR